MRISRNVAGVLVIAGLAFAAGQVDFFGGAGSAATAETLQDGGMPPEFEAMAKAGIPGEYHGYLDTLAGEWEGVFKIWMPGAPVMEMDGEINRTWVLDKHFMREEVTSFSAMGDFHGLGHIGFNNIDNRYEFVWMDSMNTGMAMAHGTYDPSAKRWVFRGQYREPWSGKLQMTRSELDVSDPDRHVLVEYISGPDGNETKHFEATMKRKTKAAVR